MYYGIAENINGEPRLLNKYVDADPLHLILTVVFDERLLDYQINKLNKNEQVLPDTKPELLGILMQKHLVPVHIPEYVATLLQNNVTEEVYYDGSTIGITALSLNELNLL